MPSKTSGRKNKNKQAETAKKRIAVKKADQKNPEKMVLLKKRFEYALLAVMVVGVSLLLFVGPFQQGLFFPRELLVAKAGIFGLLIVWGLFRLLRRESLLLNSPLDLCLAVLLLAYAVSFIGAVHKRDALTEVLKIASYLVVYLVVFDLCRYLRVPLQKMARQNEETETLPLLPPGLNFVLHLLLLAAFVVTIASLGAAAGNWEFIGAYESNRIASPIAYANTAAAYLMAAYFLAVALAPLAGQRLRALYMAPAALMLMTVILTFSRGAWLLLPPLALLLVIAAAPGERLRSFLNLFITAAVALPAAFLLDPIFRSEIPARAWVLIAGAAVTAIILGLAVEFYLGQGRKFKLYTAAAGIFVITAVIVIAVILPLMEPLHLEHSPGEPEQVKTIEQVIGKVEAGTTYHLNFEVNAEQTTLPGTEPPEYVWGVRVLEGVPGYRNVTLFSHGGEATDGWEEKTFTFQTGEEPTRLEVHFFNRYPGTSVTARSVTLVTDGQEQKLRFTLNRILPQRFYDRAFSYSLDRNMGRRFELFRDAVKVIKDYPVLGAGGGGWAAVYRGYQEQSYISREVHNHFLQVWVEAGIFGFLAFLGIWVSFAAAFIRNCLREKAPPRLWQYWTASFLPVAALGAHSAIDWNFSMAAVGLYLIVLLGAGRSLDRSRWFGRYRADQSKTGIGGLLTGVIAVILGLSLLIFSVTLIRGLDATWYSQELLEQNNVKQATAEMEKAMRLDPLRAENHHNLGVILEEQLMRSGNPANIQKMLDLSRQAYELEPFNLNYVYRYGNLQFYYADAEQGLIYIDKGISLLPFSENSYFQSAWARLKLAEFYSERYNRFEMNRYIDEILELQSLMQENFGDSQALAFVIGRAHHLQGDFTLAVHYYQMVQEGNQFYDEARSRLTEILGEDEIPDD